LLLALKLLLKRSNVSPKLSNDFYLTMSLEKKYDAIVAGGGHNGLVAAAY
jgi:ribulose 1,5-bisphosphate synthetase/thiazole synthase